VSPASRFSVVPRLTRTAVLPYINKIRRKELNLDIPWADENEEDHDEEQHKEKHAPKTKQERSREARLALQQYLVDLIRAVVRTVLQASSGERARSMSRLN
jgi:hypothetical protein